MMATNIPLLSALVNHPHLSRGSSPVDWCEDNYTHSPHIAEFWNTVSNFLFLVMPPILIHLHRPFASIVGYGIHVIWVLLVVVGLSSAYFHATLSLFGQLLDETAILWVIMAGFSMWYPKAAMPAALKDKDGSRRTFSYLILAVTIGSTWLAFIKPSINAFFLMTLGIPSIVVLGYNLKREDNRRVINLGRRSILFWVASVTCWINDRIYCNFWSSLGFPYLHGFWHVLIFLASYTAVVLFSYFDVRYNHQHETPEIRYWPNDNFEYGISYVKLKSYKLNQKDQKI